MKKIFTAIMILLLTCSMAFGATTYENYNATADKVLQPDASIVSIISGTTWAPASTTRAAQYKTMPVSAAKYLMPDGSIINGVPLTTTITGTATDGYCIKVNSTGGLVYGSCVSSITDPLTVEHGGTGVAVSGTTSQIPVGGGTSSPVVWTTATGTGAPVRADSPTLTGIVTAPVFNWSKPANIADSATPAIGAAAGNVLDLDGTTTIIGFDTVAAGVTRFLTFTGARTITYNVTSMIISGGRSIKSEAGDRAIAVSLGSGNWYLIYFKANGIVLGDLPEYTLASSGNITGSMCYGGYINNYNQAADVVGTVDAAAKGMHFKVRFGTTVNKYFRIDPNASDIIYLDGVADTAGHYVGIASAAAGQSISCETFQTGASTYAWACTTGIGPWTME